MMTIRWLREQMRLGKSIYDLPLRVTFYARVSTEKVEQQGSLENQIQYYTEFIQKNPNWTYIPGYIDEGISGTSTYKRDSFLRMIADAQRGMFDFIITKEISRFPVIRWTASSIRRSCWRTMWAFYSRMTTSIHWTVTVSSGWWSWRVWHRTRCASSLNG